MDNQTKTNLINFIRANTLTKRVDIVDNEGKHPSTLTVPQWRSDDLKLTYPDYFFTQTDIDQIVEIIKGYISDNDLNLHVEVTNDYFIEVAHCYGWKVQLIDA